MIESPRGMSIMEAYEAYRNDRLLVNRRYQRKLVWSVKEKQALIESILLRYPVPLLLFASIDNQFEIIDGMQRLNAIFGFIENEFPINFDGKDRYFKTSDYTFAQTQVSKNVFTPVQEDLDFLEQSQIASFVQYQFPITILKISNFDEINETFRRINSTGRHLSQQEVRQAGNVSKFALLVKDLASEIRGDVSTETLLLQDMPEISIDSKQLGLKYGVYAEDTFWCKHGILNISDLKESADEQFIADLVLSIALEQPFPASNKAFNNYYGSGDDDKSNEIEVKINQFGETEIKEQIKLVFGSIVSFCDSYLQAPKLKNLLNPNAHGNPVKEAFYTLFMAFHSLMVKENKEPFDFVRIEEALDDIHSKLVKSRNYTTTKDRIDNINICKGLIQDSFKTSSSTLRSVGSGAIDFRNYLMLSRNETAMYDFKQGFYTLSPNGDRAFDARSFDKILCNIAALANLGKEKQGYLFVGVTDNEEHTKQVEALDGLTDTPEINGFGVVGLEREAVLRGVTLDEYISFITKKISESELDNALKLQITRDMTPVTYHGRTVLMIVVKPMSSPVYYKDIMYFRDGANCIQIQGAKQGDVYKLFT